ncbi:MAG: methyltransferase domain-containing protein [Chloroflexi bacterium]|nr:methyltransferase domain-containing protein [Chloroflexota bacterium]
MNPVEQYYDEHVEREWAREKRHPMEFAVTRRAFDEFLPAPPLEILDVGGGPGRYALELAQRGYHVTLFDLARACLEFAERQAQATNLVLADFVHGDATDLGQFADARFDAVLLLGPLYHLTAPEARRQAVREAARVLKPHGLVLASIITRYAPLRFAAKFDPAWLTADPARCARLLEAGVPTLEPTPGGFTVAHFAHPTELEPLMRAAGFETRALIAVEGIVSGIDDALNAASQEIWQAWVELNYRLGRDSSVHGAADHVLYVGQRP